MARTGNILPDDSAAVRPSKMMLAIRFPP